MQKILKVLAVIALLGFPAAVIGFRLELFPFSTVLSLSGFSILGSTMVLALVVFFVAMVLSIIKRSDSASAKSYRVSAMIALLPVILLGTQAFTGNSVPPIHNISTDVANPPKFDKVVALRNANHNDLYYDADKHAEAQLAAYPGVKTLISDLSVVEAHARAKTVIDAMGLELVNSDPDQGIIEATETTAIWGFKDDIVVRITVKGDKTAIDLRSVSRIGMSDLGANAKRIEKFLAKF